MAINKDEVAAAMARIKALQDMLKGGPVEDDPEDDYDPNDPNQNYQDTEEDEKWREEQEKEWERQQAAERAAAAAEKAAAEATKAAAPSGAGPPTAEPASSASSTAAAAASTAGASTPATAAPASVPFTSVGPHQWTTAQLHAWLNEVVKPEVRARSDLFAAKGWTADELTRWRSELDTSFEATSSAIDAKQLTGAQISAWDLTTDAPWQQHLGVVNAYHRAAMWAHYKQALRQFAEKQP